MHDRPLRPEASGHLPDQVVESYLDRLGVDHGPPSAAGLAALHRAHVERVPYETLWIQLGEHLPIGEGTAATHIATSGRGGYCFHLNDAFGELLTALGHRVTRHLGGVHGPDGPAGFDLTNHLVLVVHDVPTATNPGGRWYVDVGLGDALHDPLPLVPGVYRQGPFRLVLDETPGSVGDWHLTHDPLGGFTGMSWRSAPTRMEEFADRHHWLSTSPDSGFVKVLTVQRRDATGVDILHGLVLQRVSAVDSDGESAPEASCDRSETVLTSSKELYGCLTEHFGLDLSRVEEGAFSELWTRLQASHEAWEAAGRP